MRIAILDYLVIPTNAIGNCNRQIMASLCDEHEFVVFSVQFDNPNPEKIKYVRIPVPRKPLFLLFIAYHFVAPIVFWLYKLRHRVTFDLVQGIESKSLHNDLIYSHFCHRAYLRDHWAASGAKGLGGAARWLNQALQAFLEPIVYRRAKHVVVPSRGLSVELKEFFGQEVLDKTTVISNPVNVSRMTPEPTFDPMSIRQPLGMADDDLVLVFVALGHFERKGLPILLDALEQVGDTRVKLLVVGGNESALSPYRTRVAAQGLENQVHFVGMQKDVRPYLWASDVFAFPSSYEIFPLVSLEAAAAGLPLLVGKLYGVEEFLVDGVNGWCVERTPEALAERIRYALLHRDVLRQMGQRVHEDVRAYDAEHFVENWRQFYANWNSLAEQSSWETYPAMASSH